jgi:hypothetical protein
LAIAKPVAIHELMITGRWDGHHHDESQRGDPWARGCRLLIEPEACPNHISLSSSIWWICSLSAMQRRWALHQISHLFLGFVFLLAHASRL